MTHTQTPRLWKAIALDFVEAVKVTALRDEFGAAGPLALIVLLTKAQQQEYMTLDKTARTPGVVKLAYSTFTHLAALGTRDAAVALLGRLESLGEATVVDYGHAFTATLTDWDRWAFEPKDPAEAARSRGRRSKAGRRPDEDRHRDMNSNRDMDSGDQGGGT
jgi:hypothetical protein